jgi:hypothetical protein
MRVRTPWRFFSQMLVTSGPPIFGAKTTPPGRPAAPTRPLARTGLWPSISGTTAASAMICFSASVHSGAALA